MTLQEMEDKRIAELHAAEATAQFSKEKRAWRASMQVELRNMNNKQARTNELLMHLIAQLQVGFKPERRVPPCLFPPEIVAGEDA